MTEKTPVFTQKINHLIEFVSHPIVAWSVFVGAVILTILGYVIAERNVQNRAHDQFEFRAEKIALAITDRMNLYEQSLRGGVGLFLSSDHVSRGEWRSYVSSLDMARRLPGIQGMGFAVPLEPDELERHQETIRAEGFPDYQVLPPGKRDFYTAIKYLEPFDWRNQRAFGYDMYSNAVRREAMLAARQTKAPRLTGMVTLVQETETDTQKGFLLYLPVFKYRLEEGSAKLQDYFVGWVYAPFRARDLMYGILPDNEYTLNYELYDTHLMGYSTLLFDSDDQLSVSESAEPSGFDLTKHLNMFGRPWTLHVTASDDQAFVGVDRNQPLFVLLVGGIVDALLLYVIFSLNLINRNARKLAEELECEYLESKKHLAWQAKLVESKEEEANAFFELAPEAFLVVARNGKIIRANNHAHELFEFRPGEMMGISVETLIPREYADGHEKKRLNYQLNSHPKVMGYNRELEGLKSNGARFSVAVNLKPIDIGGEQHTIAAVHDISMQKNIERTLAQAKESAEAASRSKSEFVANMSHEIRTPLNAVLGSAQLLEKTNPKPSQRKYISMIRSSGEALLGVINDILDFSKIEAGRLELTYVPFDLDEVITRVGVMMSVNVGEKNLELIVDVSPEVPKHLMGDPLRLQQVLINLVSNAIKFTDEGTVTLEVRKVSPSRAQDANAVGIHFTVRDTGLGMDAEQKSRLFKAFTQADESITRRFGGTGLGLVISNRIVNAMGGSIDVHSELGVGSVFSCQVRMAVAPGVHNETVTEKKTVLVLDNHQAALQAIKNVLDSLGWQCECYASLDAVKKRLMVLNKTINFDFVLLDSDFGKRQSHEVFNDICSAGLNKSCIPIILSANTLKAANLSEAERVAFGAGMVKPIVKTNLMDALQEAFIAEHDKPLFDNITRQLVQSRKLSGVRILLVEDNALNQTVALGMLEDMGVMDVTVADNGLECIEQIKTKADFFDIVLMDIQMPVMDGLTATKKIRLLLKSELPIIAMTAGVLKSERREYLDAGMNDFVAKPVDERELFNVISKYYTQEMRQRATEEDKSSPEKPLVDKAPSQLNLSINGRAPDKPNAVCIFDTERIASITKNKPEREARIADALNNILVDQENKISEAKAALDNNDYSQVKFIFHSLKGVVANYGANELADSIRVLETKIAAKQDEATILACIQSVDGVFERFRQEVTPWIAEKSNSNRDEDQIIDVTLPQQIVDALCRATRMQDITAIERSAGELEEIGEEGKALAKKIRVMLDNLDTTGIKTMIEALANAKN